MVYTYEFKQPDGSYKTQTVDTDMSNTAGYRAIGSNDYSTANIRQINSTVSGTQGINQVNTSTNPIQNQTPLVNTNPTNQVSTGQNTMFRVNDPNALTSLLQQSGVGQQEFEKNYITRNADGSIYLKPAALKLKTQGLVTPVNIPISRNIDIPTTIPQNTFSALNSPSSLNDIQNKINNAEELYTQALQKATSLQAPSSTLRQDLYADTNFEALNKQLIDIDNQIRTIQDKYDKAIIQEEETTNLTNLISGKINKANREKLIELSPLQRERQYLADQVNAIKQQVSEQVADTYNAFNIQWQQAQGNTQLQMQYMNNLQDYANQLYERSRKENVDYLQALNFSLNLPEGEKVTLPDGTQIEGRKVNDTLSAQIETDSFGNSTLVMFDKTAAANALKQGKTPQITKVNLGQISGGMSINDRINLLNQNLTYDPITGQLVQDVSKASVEQIAEAIKTIESNSNYNAKGGSGEFGAYQFMPSTWYSWSREYQQATGEIPSGTPENQDAVAQFKINQWLSQGLTPEQIFAKWNSGSEVGWENKIGINQYGQNYNVPAYVNKGINTLRNIVAQSVVETQFTPEFYATDYGQKVLNNEQQYQTNFLSQPLVKSYLEVANKAESVSKIIDSGVGGPGDLALVFEFMKGLDPSSVVRESEYESAAKSGNIFLGALAKFNGYLKEEGGMLPDNVKESFRNIVQTKLDVYEAQYNQLRNQFRTTAEQQGLNPDHVAPDLKIDFNNNTYTSESGNTYILPN